MSKIINWVVYGNFWISIGAMALMQSSAHILGLKLSWKLYFLVFLATLCTYNLSTFYISKPISRKFIFMEKNRQILQFLAVFSGIFSLIVALFSGLNVVLFLAHLGFISIFYTIPLKFKPFFVSKNINLGSLRQIPYLKVVLVAYVWACVSVVLPLVELQKAIFESNVLILFFVQFLFIIAITLPFDIRDFRTDKHTGLRTLAQKSIRRTKFLGILILGISELFVILYFPMGVGLAFSLTYVVAGMLILFASPQRPELYYTGWIDGIIVLQFVMSELGITFDEI